MLLRLVILALMLMVAIGCGATPTEKPDSTQGESQSVVESPKTTTAVPPIAVPTPSPVTLTGEGEKATEFFELKKGLWIVKLEHYGSSNFQGKLLDGDGDRVESLANEIGSFEGSLAITIDESAAYLMDVNADGSWSIGFSLSD